MQTHRLAAIPGHGIGVELIEAGTISRDPGLFVEDYMLYVANERATSVAHILRDLGVLDATETFFIRC